MSCNSGSTGFVTKSGVTRCCSHTSRARSTDSRPLRFLSALIFVLQGAARHVVLKLPVALTGALLTAANAHGHGLGRGRGRRARSCLPWTHSLQLPRAVRYPSSSGRSTRLIVADWAAPYLVPQQLLSVVVPTFVAEAAAILRLWDRRVRAVSVAAGAPRKLVRPALW